MSQEYLPTILNALQEATFILDDRRMVLFANPVATALFGNDKVGEDFVKVYRHPDCIRAISQVLSGEEKSQNVIAEDSLAGATYQINVADLGADNVDDAKAVVCIMDISDMREAKQMRSDFVANVSHELRSPLTALSGFIETLRDPNVIDSDARDRFLRLMDLEANRMTRLISDLLSLSKIESKQRMRPQGTASVAGIVNRITATLQDQAAKEGKVFDVAIEEAIPSIPGSEDELTQVFQNLIENAVKYGRPDSKISIAIKMVEQIPGIPGSAVVVEINDESEGIAQQHIPRLTERFYRVDTHRSRDKGGTGLGLAIVKHIINRHRGRLAISSTEGVGSCFTVCLPTTDPRKS